MINTVHENINEDIHLYSGPATISIGSTQSVGHVELKNCFLPNNKLKFYFNGLNFDSLKEIINKQVFKGTLVIDDFDFQAEITIADTNIGGDAPDLLGEVFRSKSISNAEAKQVSTLFFSVFNLPYIWSRELVQHDGWSSVRLRFPHNEFELILDSVQNLSNKYKELAKVKGHLITYHGVLYRRDKESFSRVEAESVLDILRNTLSFSQGRYIEINYLKGMSENRIIFQNVRSYISYPTIKRVTWFDSMEPDSLYSVFKGMTDLMNHQVWASEISKALHWYYTSLYDQAMEISIVLNQSALELLIWCYFVEDKKSYSKSKFKELRFHQRLEAMLKEIEHPNLKFQPRTHLEKFREVNCRKEDPWHKAFTQVRNYIIHPDQKHKIDDDDFRPKWDVRELGIHLIEVIVLFLCDFEGKAVISMDKPFIHGKTVELAWDRK